MDVGIPMITAGAEFTLLNLGFPFTFSSRIEYGDEWLVLSAVAQLRMELDALAGEFWVRLDTWIRVFSSIIARWGGFRLWDINLSGPYSATAIVP